MHASCRPRVVSLRFSDHRASDKSLTAKAFSERPQSLQLSPVAELLEPSEREDSKLFETECRSEEYGDLSHKSLIWAI